MTARMTDALLPLAAAIWLVTSAGGAAAFSQIGSEDGGESSQKEGIVSVPLPPIASPARAGSDSAAPAASPAPAPAAVPADTAAPKADEPGVTPAVTPAAVPDSPAPAAAPTRSLTGTNTPGAEPESLVSPVGPGPGPGPAEPTDSSGDENMPEDATIVPAEVFYGDADLPKPVRDLRARLIEICKSGEIEGLRPYLETGDDATTVSFGASEGDPIDFLKAASGDGQGVEILAIMLEVLQAGHVHSDVGSDNEIFVWPYFTGVPLDKLTKPQQVQLFELVTAGDYQEMLGFGAYNFYRAGISPDGKLQFFVAGD